MRIAFIGVPCSGKSTMAREIAKAIGGSYIPETARVLIEAMGRRPTKEDQRFIMLMQSHLENSMMGEHKVSDVPIFLNHIYYRLYWGDDENSKELLEIAKKHRYDMIFKLSPLPYKDDSVRYQNKEEIKKVDDMIDEYEADFGLYTYIHATDLRERVKTVLEDIRYHENLLSVPIQPRK